jgi:hypothetical protein
VVWTVYIWNGRVRGRGTRSWKEKVDKGRQARAGEKGVTKMEKKNERERASKAEPSPRTVDDGGTGVRSAPPKAPKISVHIHRPTRPRPHKERWLIHRKSRPRSHPSLARPTTSPLRSQPSSHPRSTLAPSLSIGLER